VLLFVVLFLMFVLQVHAQSSIISNNFLLCSPYSYCFNIASSPTKVVLAMVFFFVLLENYDDISILNFFCSMFTFASTWLC
jgi:hypothetical protein